MSSFTNELGKNIMEIATTDDSLQELEKSSESCEDIIQQGYDEDDETSSMSESDIHAQPTVQEPVVICNTNDKKTLQTTEIKIDSSPNNNTLINTGNPPIQVCVHPPEVDKFAEILSHQNNIEIPIHPVESSVVQQSKVNIPTKSSTTTQKISISNPTICSTKKYISNSCKMPEPSVQQQLMKKPIEPKKVRFDNSKLATTIPLSPKPSNTQIALVAQTALQRATKAFHMPVSTLYFLITFLCLGIGFYLYQKYVTKSHQTQ